MPSTRTVGNALCMFGSVRCEPRTTGGFNFGCSYCDLDGRSVPERAKTDIAPKEECLVHFLKEIYIDGMERKVKRKY